MFFTKVNGVLNVEIYKWYDKKPGDKVFSGNITVISLQDITLSAYAYVNGQLQNSGFISLLNHAQSKQPSRSSANQVQSSGAVINLNNGSKKTLRASLTAPKQRKTIANFILDIGCWLAGGTVTEGEVDGCEWGNGSIYNDIGNFLAGIFGGGGGDIGSSFGSYGAGSVGFTSSDGSSLSFSTGSGGMAYLTINNPCTTAPPPWYNSAGSSVIKGSKTLRVQQDANNPCGSNYTTTQWVPIPVAPPASAAVFTPTSLNLPPCIANVVSKVALEGFVITQMSNIFNDGAIQDTYGVNTMINTVMNNPNYPIVFSAGNSQPGTNAATDPVNLKPSTTELQNAYLATTTTLSLARTIIHESIHANFKYGLANLQNDPNFTHFQIINSLLFDSNGTQQLNQNNAQHNQMVQDYINGISQLLTHFANDNSITSPDPSRTILQYCTDLAWGGLQFTDAYKNLTQTDRVRINATLFNEQEGNSNATQQKPCQ
ncbi:MAG: hypothetical protein M3N14_09970 [Bacteroidota bacterium]|nr:hypothetical protein [Bacteroidota bacterium]